ncbi:hypothetical protein BD408DRAFT_423664 [Parasitella parasitica]|nr:hypothetical protein BD408DRAFT_423664 [Parasitella parasitica]
MLNTVYTQNTKAGSPKKNYKYWTEYAEADVFEHSTLPRALTLGSKQINQDTGLHNTSQTCVFCFHKLCHPVVALNSKMQRTAGSFLCLNPECPNAFKTMCRDQVSALAIGLAGLGCLLFGGVFPCFDPNPTTAKRIQFN